MTSLIGISGRKGTGKTTLADFLVNMIPNAEIVALADALKDDVQIMLGCMVKKLAPHEAWEQQPVSRPWLDARKGDIFGPLCQGYGEFARQWFGPTYWIDAVQDYIDGAEGNETFIVPDVRHINEAEWIKSEGGLLVAIYGPSRWANDTRSEQHASEAHVEECQKLADIEVPNGGTLKDLEGWARIVAGRVANHGN